VVAVFNDKINELHRTNTVRLVLISLCIVIGVIVTITLGFVSGPVGFAVSLLVFAGEFRMLLHSLLSGKFSTRIHIASLVRLHSTCSRLFCGTFKQNLSGN